MAAKKGPDQVAEEMAQFLIPLLLREIMGTSALGKSTFQVFHGFSKGWSVPSLTNSGIRKVWQGRADQHSAIAAHRGH